MWPLYNIADIKHTYLEKHRSPVIYSSPNFTFMHGDVQVFNAFG